MRKFLFFVIIISVSNYVFASEKEISVENISIVKNDLLDNINGVSFMRYGGFGKNYSIRSGYGSRINVITNGVTNTNLIPYITNIQSNALNIASYDKISIVSGYDDTKNGFAGQNGGIILSRNRTENGIKSSFINESNGNGKLGNVDISSNAGKFYLRNISSISNYGDYKTGIGKISSSYSKKNNDFILGYDDGSNKAEFIATINDVNKAVSPALKMDLDELEEQNFSFNFTQKYNDGNLKKMEFLSFANRASYKMDNFSMRNDVINNGDKSALDGNSETYGTKIIAYHEMSGFNVNTGFEYQDVQSGANKFDYAGNLSDNILPSTKHKKHGFFAESEILRENTTIKFGGRYDYIESYANNIGKNSAIYSQYYSRGYVKRIVDHNASGLIKVTHNFAENNKLFYGISHSERSADNIERYMVDVSNLGSNFNGNVSIIGNPNLKTERHNQADLGFSNRGNNSKFNLNIYTDLVNNYISTIIKNNTVIYKNIDVLLYGADAETAYILYNFVFKAGISYNAGRNLNYKELGREMPKIQPLTSKLSIGYNSSKVNSEVILYSNAGQNQVQYGERKTGGYSIVDINNSLNLGKNFALQFGVQNLFNKKYNRHLSGYSMKEPGISFTSGIQIKL